MEEINDEIFGVFAAHVSLTFISISVLSMLSDKSNVIYWKDIVETRLIEPPFSCFSAYTTYSITTIVVSFIAILASNAILFAMGFLVNIVVLVCLTKSMLDVYYKRNVIKKELKVVLLNAYKNKQEGNSKEFDEIAFLFESQVARAVASHDITYLDEVVELSIEYPEMFEDTIIQEILKVIGESEYSGFFIDSCIRYLEANAKKHISEYKTTGKSPSDNYENPKIDKALWLGYVNKNKQSLIGEDSILEDSLSALANKLKNRVATFYNTLLPLWIYEGKIPNEKIDDYYLIYLNGKITTKTKNTLEKELEIKKREKEKLESVNGHIEWYLLEKAIVATLEDNAKEKFKAKEEKIGQYCMEYFNKTGKEVTPEQLKEHNQKVIKDIEETIRETKNKQTKLQEEFDRFADSVLNFDDEIFEFVYLIVYVLVEIYGERFKNERKPDYERKRFRYWFNDFPFYKYFVYNMPDDAFPDHKEFMEFLSSTD